MKFSPQQRQRIMLWHLKLATMIEQTFPDDTANEDAENEALQIALIEIAVSNMWLREGDTGTMTILNQVMYDIFDSERDPDHWRHKETAHMIAAYNKAISEL